MGMEGVWTSSWRQGGHRFSHQSRDVNPRTYAEGTSTEGDENTWGSRLVMSRSTQGPGWGCSARFVQCGGPVVWGPLEATEPWLTQSQIPFEVTSVVQLGLRCLGTAAKMCFCVACHSARQAKSKGSTLTRAGSLTRHRSEV